MVFAGKLMLGVVASGVLLGSGLASLAEPVPKAGPDAPWAGRFSEQLSYAPGYDYIEPLPQDLSPYDVPGGYAPAFARSELAELWQEDLTMPEYADFESDPATDAFWTTRTEPAALPEHDEPALSAPQYASVVETSSAAQSAAEEAANAKPSEAETMNESAAKGEARLIQVAQTPETGLY